MAAGRGEGRASRRGGGWPASPHPSRRPCQSPASAQLFPRPGGRPCRSSPKCRRLRKSQGAGNGSQQGAGTSEPQLPAVSPKSGDSVLGTCRPPLGPPQLWCTRPTWAGAPRAHNLQPAWGLRCVPAPRAPWGRRVLEPWPRVLLPRRGSR